MTRQSAEVTLALILIERQGMPLREAAEKCGVAPSSLVRARKRLGLPPLKPGRPKRKVEERAA